MQFWRFHFVVLSFKTIYIAFKKQIKNRLTNIRFKRVSNKNEEGTVHSFIYVYKQTQAIYSIELELFSHKVKTKLSMKPFNDIMKQIKFQYTRWRCFPGELLT